MPIIKMYPGNNPENGMAVLHYKDNNGRWEECNRTEPEYVPSDEDEEYLAELEEQYQAIIAENPELAQE